MQPEPLPESQDHCDWRESKSRSPFFRSLLGVKSGTDRAKQPQPDADFLHQAEPGKLPRTGRGEVVPFTLAREVAGLALPCPSSPPCGPCSTDRSIHRHACTRLGCWMLLPFMRRPRPNRLRTMSRSVCVSVRSPGYAGWTSGDNGRGGWSCIPLAEPKLDLGQVVAA